MIIMIKPTIILMLTAFAGCSAQGIGLERNTISSSVGNNECSCILLRQCLPLFRPGQRITFQQANEIRRRRCGFEGRNLKVCCPGPMTRASFTTAPPTPAPPSHPTTLPVTCGNVVDPNKIHGGVEASLGAHPWAVALGFTVPSLGGRESVINFRCGGSLITSQHVLTAAHCIHPTNHDSTVLTQLNLGEWNTQTDPDCFVDGLGTRECAPPVTVRRPAKITWHPQYNTNGRYNNDIAVIRLDSPVEFNFYVRPICIPDTFRAGGEGYSTPLAIGWGETDQSSSSAILQQVRLPFVDFQACNASFRGRLSGHQVCAGGEAGRDTCNGDSGGPLVATGSFRPTMELIGLTSFGKTYCGQENNFAVYTIVADYRDWIIQALKL